MTALDLDTIKARADAATDGPWKTKTNARRSNTTVILTADERFVAHYVNPSDAHFIAHARTDVPALVAEVRRLLVEVDRLHNLLDGYRGALTETEADRDLFRKAAGWGERP